MIVFSGHSCGELVKLEEGCLFRLIVEKSEKVVLVREIIDRQTDFLGLVRVDVEVIGQWLEWLSEVLVVNLLLVVHDDETVIIEHIQSRFSVDTVGLFSLKLVAEEKFNLQSRVLESIRAGIL